MKNKILMSTLAGVIGATTILHPVDAASDKNQISKLKKEKAALQKEVKTLKSQKAKLYSDHESLKSKYSKLDKSYQAVLKENKLLKDKVKTLSQGYQLLETKKQFLWNGDLVNKSYKSTPSLLLLKNTPYIPLDLAARLNNLPLKSTSSSFELGIPKNGVSLSTLKHEKSSFDNVLYNYTMEVRGKTSVSNIIFDQSNAFDSRNKSALYYLNNFTTFETDVLVTPKDVATKLSLSGRNGNSLTFKISDVKTKKILAEYKLNHDEDPVHIKLDVRGIDGLQFTIDSPYESSSATLSNPLLTK